MKRIAKQSGSGGRLRLGLLMASVAAFLLIPAASAFATPVNGTIEGSGTGSGWVKGVETLSGEGPEGGNPIIECHWNGETQKWDFGTSRTTGEKHVAGLNECTTNAQETVPGVGNSLAVNHEADPGSLFEAWKVLEGAATGCVQEEPGAGTCTVASFSGATPIKIRVKFGAEPVPPTNLTPPTITGTAKVGKTLHGHAGTWEGGPETLTNQWLRCNAAGEECNPIAGEVGTEYEVTEEDISSTIRYEETAENGLGSASAQSAQTEVVPAATGNGEAILTPERNVYGEVEQTTELTSECAEELSLGNFLPGKAQAPEVPCLVVATSTGEESSLTASDQTGEEVGYLTQEPEHPYTLAQLLEAQAVDLLGLGNSHSNGFGTFGEVEGPYTMLTYGKPVAGDEVEVTFKQPIAKTDPLHTGVYQKTVTLTLAQTTL